MVHHQLAEPKHRVGHSTKTDLNPLTLAALGALTWPAALQCHRPHPVLVQERGKKGGHEENQGARQHRSNALKPRTTYYLPR